MNSEKHYTAVVVGDDHQNTLGVIRSLGEGGIRVKAVILSDGGGGATACSRYLDEVVVVRPSKLMDVLVQLGLKLKGKTPLIPCGDNIVAIIAQNFECLSDLYYLPGAVDGKNMLRLMNKVEMLKTAQSVGLNVPKWVTVTQESFVYLKQRCRDLCFPCIVKPIEIKASGHFEFQILRNLEDLESSMNYITNNCVSVIIQEWVSKTNEYGINGCRLYRSGETIFGGIIEKQRFSQTSLGSTTAGYILQEEHNLFDAAKRFVEYIDYRGIFDMEFITDGREYYFVEINFRNGGYGYAYTKAGRNFPAIWVSDACGAPVEGYLSKPLRTIFFVNESADLQNVRTGNISIFTWITDVFRAKARMYINLWDMKPLVKKILGR